MNLGKVFPQLSTCRVSYFVWTLLNTDHTIPTKVFGPHSWPKQVSTTTPEVKILFVSCVASENQASFWVKGRNPFHFHRIESPDCKYITGHCEENVPFHTREQRNRNLSYLEPNRSGTRPAPSQGAGGPGRLVADGHRPTAPAQPPPSNQVTAPSVNQGSNSFSIEARPRNRLGQPQRSAPEVVQSLPIGSTTNSLSANPQVQHQQSEPSFQSLPAVNHISLDSRSQTRPAPSAVVPGPSERCEKQHKYQQQ